VLAAASPDTARGHLAAIELFAGGTTGLLVIHGSSAGELRVWRRLLEAAESLGFSGCLTRSAGAAPILRSLGVPRLCAVAAGLQAEAALRMAAHGDVEALILVSPRIRSGAATADSLGSLRIPRLLIGGSDPRDVEAVREIARRSIGPVMLRYVPSPAYGHRLLDSDVGPLVGETVSLFAARTLGLDDGSNKRRSTSALEEEIHDAAIEWARSPSA
jgi:hypothetical protein